MLPTICEVGRLVDDPEMRFTPTGMAVCKMRIVFSARKKNPNTQEWEDGDTLWIDGTAFKQLAENIAESLTRGMEVLIKGRIKTDEWEDRETGKKRSKTVLLIDAIGPSIAFATAKVQKMSRSGGPGTDGPRATGGGGGFADDPWASATPASGARTPQDDGPPF